MSDEPAILQEVLGYLNFSSGKPDPRLLRNLNELFASIESQQPRHAAPGVTPQIVQQRLQARLDELAGEAGAFENAEQCRGVLPLVFEHLPKRYRQFHHDLLFHETDAEIWRPFFVGRACEAVLRRGRRGTKPTVSLTARLRN